MRSIVCTLVLEAYDITVSIFKTTHSEGRNLSMVIWFYLDLVYTSGRDSMYQVLEIYLKKHDELKFFDISLTFIECWFILFNIDRMIDTWCRLLHKQLAAAYYN